MVGVALTGLFILIAAFKSEAEPRGSRQIAYQAVRANCVQLRFSSAWRRPPIRSLARHDLGLASGPVFRVLPQHALGLVQIAGLYWVSLCTCDIGEARDHIARRLGKHVARVPRFLEVVTIVQA